ncbi:MAG: hypothetical protein HRU70_07420 [Phycisphaeraceae bacterium]|nr:MAG: hypothetical protein HRU70_07420 [Phycisphaeraceae bacterium]
MSKSEPLSARTLVTAAGLLIAVPVSVSPAWGEPEARVGGEKARWSTASAALKEASDLLAVSKVVRAKAVLVELTGESWSLSDAERREALSLLKAVEERSRGMGRYEVSLQKAELGLETRDLREAESHAKAVAHAKAASVDERRRADEVLAKVDAARQELSPKVASAVRSAINAYDSGEYERSKAILDVVLRSGIELASDQRGLVDDYAQRIVEIEQSRGRAFGGAAAGMLQPGVIRKREDAPAKEPEPETFPALAAAPAQPAAAPAAAGQPDVVADARKAASAEVLQRAEESFNAKRFSEALAGYERAKREFADLLSPEQALTVDQRIAASRLELRRDVGPEGGALDQFKGDVSQRKQQFLAEFRNYLANAAAAREAGDVDNATRLLAEASLVLAKNGDVCTEQERSDFRRQVSEAQADVAKTRDAIAASEASERERALRTQAEEVRLRGSQERAQKIRENIDRVRALQRERKYGEALQVVNQILFLDPLNPTGLLLRDVLSDMQTYAAYNQKMDRLSRDLAQTTIDNLDALIPPKNIVDYPAEWPNITELRGEPVAFQETPENRQMIARLSTQRIPKADFPEVPLEAALAYVQRVGNVNMDVDWASLESVGIQKDTTVSLNITNPTLKVVLDRVLDKVSTSTDINSRAGWTVNDGVLQVASEEMLRRNTIMVIYDIRDLLLEIRDKTNAPTFDLNSAFQSGGGGGGGQSPFQNQGQQDQGGPQRPLEDRIRDLRTIITEQVDRDGWQDNGGNTGTIQVWQGNLIIRNTPRNHREIEGLLSQLRKVRNLQINVEARFLLVNQDFFEQIGFDVDVYLNARGNQVRFLRGFDYASMPSDFFDDQGRLRRTVGSGTPVIDTDGDGIPDSPIPPGAGGGIGVVPPENFTPVGIINRSLGITSGLMNSSFANEIRAAGPALGISGTFLDDIQVDFLVEATQADRRSVTVTAPRLTFTNGQFANMYVATQVAYVSDLTPQVSEGSAAFDAQIGYANEGVRLVVGGTISSDRRYVTLDVETQVSQLKRPFRVREINAVVAGAGGGGGGIIQSGSVGSFVELPETTVQSVSTIVTVPDQGTLLLGGQRVASEVEVESGVPVLSKIPILNRFFSNRALSKEDRTLMMLIKPTVLIQDEQEDRAYPGLRDAVRAGIGG